MKFHIYPFIFLILALILSTFNYEILHIKINHISFLTANPNRNQESRDSSPSTSKVTDRGDSGGDDKEDNEEDEGRCTSMDSCISISSVSSDSTVGSTENEQYSLEGLYLGDTENKLHKILMGMDSLEKVEEYCRHLLSNLALWERKKQDKSENLKKTYASLIKAEKILESMDIDTKTQSKDGTGTGDVGGAVGGDVDEPSTSKDQDKHKHKHKHKHKEDTYRWHHKHQRILDKIKFLKERLKYIEQKIESYLLQAGICDEVISIFEKRELERRQVSNEAASLLQDIVDSMTTEEKEKAESNRKRTVENFFRKSQ